MLAALAVLAGGSVAVSWAQPMVADDYSALNVIADHPSLPAFLVHWYTGWIGRILPTVVMWAATQHHVAFSIVNGLVAAALPFVVFTVGADRTPSLLRRRDMIIVMVTALALFWGLPSVEEDYLWASGSAAYLWPSAVMLLFVHRYARWLAEPRRSISAVSARVPGILAMLVLGAIVGSAHEQAIPPALVVVAFTLAAARARGRIRDVPPSLWAGAVGLVIGVAVLVTAPGNAVRLAHAPSAEPSLLGHLSAIKTISVLALEQVAPLLPWLLFLAVLAVPLLPATRAASGDSRVPPAVWLLAAAASVSPFALWPALYAARTLLYPIVLTIVALISMSTSEGYDDALDKLPTRAMSLVLAAIVAVVALHMYWGVVTARSIRAQISQRESAIQRQIAAGERDIVVRPVKIPDRRAQYARHAVYWTDLTKDPTHYINEELARYYGVDSIRLGADPSR